ncbi:MAG: hypothetical protein ACQKBY_00835 [Verrucomicrobiales bacterium]
MAAEAPGRSWLPTLVLVFILVCLLVWAWKWATQDALKRGKSPFAVFLAVVFFFPWGLIAWLTFRPEILKCHHELAQYK